MIIVKSFKFLCLIFIFFLFSANGIGEEPIFYDDFTTDKSDEYQHVDIFQNDTPPSWYIVDNELRLNTWAGTAGFLYKNPEVKLSHIGDFTEITFIVSDGAGVHGRGAGIYLNDTLDTAGGAEIQFEEAGSLGRRVKIPGIEWYDWPSPPDAFTDSEWTTMKVELIDFVNESTATYEVSLRGGYTLDATEFSAPRNAYAGLHVWNGDGDNVRIDKFSIFSKTYTIGTGGDFTSLTDDGGLFEAINDNGINRNINAIIISDLNETGDHALEYFGPDYSVTIMPDESKNTIFTLNGNFNGDLIRFNGCHNVTIDGTEGKRLLIKNTDQDGRAINIANGASSIKILNCQLTAGEAINISGGNAIEIARNKIFNYGEIDHASNIVRGIHINGDNSNLNIHNNMITLNPHTTDKVYGFHFTAGNNDNLNVYFNSIYLSGNGGGSFILKRASDFNVGETLNIKNNIFYNARTTDNNHAIYLQKTDNMDVNFNLYYAENGYIGYDGTQGYSNIEAWKGKIHSDSDIDSDSTALIFKQFESGNLSFEDDVANLAVFNKGTQISGIEYDYFGYDRNKFGDPAMPDIGAYEKQGASIDMGTDIMDSLPKEK